jgi:hypothetical protein
MALGPGVTLSFKNDGVQKFMIKTALAGAMAALIVEAARDYSKGWPQVVTGLDLGAICVSTHSHESKLSVADGAITTLLMPCANTSLPAGLLVDVLASASCCCWIRQSQQLLIKSLVPPTSRFDR